jgi:hypothetical protein
MLADRLTDWRGCCMKRWVWAAAGVEMTAHVAACWGSWPKQSVCLFRLSQRASNLCPASFATKCRGPRVAERPAPPSVCPSVPAHWPLQRQDALLCWHFQAKWRSAATPRFTSVSATASRAKSTSQMSCDRGLRRPSTASRTSASGQSC